MVQPQLGLAGDISRNRQAIDGGQVQHSGKAGVQWYLHLGIADIHPADIELILYLVIVCILFLEPLCLIQVLFFDLHIK